MLWRKFLLVHLDIKAAETLLDDGQNLPNRLWAALLWKMTDLPTAPCCWSPASNSWGVAAELVDAWANRHAIQYLRPAELADNARQWHKALGRRQMLDYLDFLDDETARQGAWNYAHGVYRISEQNDPGPYPEGAARNPIDRIRQKVARPGIGHFEPHLRLVDTTAGQKGEALPTPSEEARRAELRLQADELMHQEAAAAGTAGSSKPDALDTFYEEFSDGK